MQKSTPDYPRLTGEHALKSIIDTWIYGIEDRLISAGFDEADPALTDQTAKESEAVLTRVSDINSGLAASPLTYYQANNRGDFTTSQSAIDWIAGEQTVGRTFKSQAGLERNRDGRGHSVVSQWARAHHSSGRLRRTAGQLR